MVNLRSKSSSPCRISTRLRSDSPIRKALTVRTKMKIFDQFKAASSISIVAEENNLAYSVVKRAVTKKQLEFIQGDRFRDYGGGAKLAYPEECELYLVQTIQTSNNKRLKVDYRLFRTESNKILDKYCIEKSTQRPKLKFSDCWINCFMERRNLSVRQKTHAAQQKIYDLMKHFDLTFEYLSRLNR